MLSSCVVWCKNLNLSELVCLLIKWEQQIMLGWIRNSIWPLVAETQLQELKKVTIYFF